MHANGGFGAEWAGEGDPSEQWLNDAGLRVKRSFERDLRTNPEYATCGTCGVPYSKEWHIDIHATTCKTLAELNAHLEAAEAASTAKRFPPATIPRA